MATEAADETTDSPITSGFRLTVIDGGEGTFEGQGARCAVGTHESNDLRLADPKVSRFHCEVLIDGPEARIRDLGSRNGTVVDGVRAVEVFLRSGSTIKIGSTTLRFDVLEQVRRLPISARRSFH